MTDEEARRVLEFMYGLNREEYAQAIRHALRAIDDRAALVGSLHGVAPTVTALDASRAARRHMRGEE